MTLARGQVLVEALARAVLDGVLEFEGEPDRIRVDLGLVAVFADERPLQGLAGLIDWRRSGRLSSLVRAGFCTGAAGERVLMPGCAGLPVERLVLVGLGLRSEFDAEAARRVAGDLVKTATGLGAERVLVALPSHAERRPAELLFAALTEAIEQAEGERAIDETVESPAELAPEPKSPAHAAGENELPPLTIEPAIEPATEPATEPLDEASTPPEAAPGPDPEPRELAELESAPDPAASKPLVREPPQQWWVVADERVVARLRRVLSGPPRATSGGLHT